jgi:tryptophan synthase alpha chain
MNRLELTLGRLREEGRAAKIVYVTSGYPDLKTTGYLVPELVESGADIVEIGIPFSDPVADGPVIQEASFRALKNGYGLKDHFKIIRHIRSRTEIPLVIMTYANIVFEKDGFDSFCQKAAAAGADGLIVPDLPVDESESCVEACRRAGLCLVQIAASSSSDERLKRIVRMSRGFVYVVSRAGVTGGQLKAGNDLADLARRLRRMTDIPLCVGFGISSKADVAKMSKMFDGVIVGSAFLKRMLEDKGRTVHALAFIRQLFN